MIQRQTPKVVKWFKVYCGILAFLYVLCIAMGAFLLLLPSLIPADEWDEEDEGAEIVLYVEGVVIMIMGVAFTIACALPLFLKPKPWVWIYDLVIICLGLSSMLLLPFCIPLLIFWVKPETKAYFGRT